MRKFDFKKINIDGLKEKVKNIDVQDLKQKSKDIKNYKWCLIISGIIMILLGICSVFRSEESILSLDMCLGFGFVITGIAHIFTFYLYKNDPADHPKWFLPQGVFEIILGFIFIANLGVTRLSIPLMVAFWALFDGVMRTTASYQWKKAGMGKWSFLLSAGIVSVLFALLLLARPWASVISSTFLIGIALFAWGITAILESFKLYD
jgi:uncharacterized membrane protein HdeD (DUF308 family)